MDGVTIKHEAEDFTAEEHLVQHNMGDGSNKSLPASGLNAVNAIPNRLTIFYNGSVCIYDGIPAEKVHEIMHMAAAAAKSNEIKKIGKQAPLLSPVPSRPSSPEAHCFSAKKSAVCRLQEFPIARRHSLQRFLEKRRDRLGSKAPYPTSPTMKVADNIENDLDADKLPDSVSMKCPAEEFQPTISAS